MVIGGGPAGMEAARVARLKGHRVTLVEASQNLGGQVAMAKRAPFLHTIGDIAYWLEQEIYRLGVEVRTGNSMEASGIHAQKPAFELGKPSGRERVCQYVCVSVVGG